jgi:enoyl-CoA hydratase
MEVMGIRTAIRAGTELCALGTHTASLQKFVQSIQEQGLTDALSARDGRFADYRTSEVHGTT